MAYILLHEIQFAVKMVFQFCTFVVKVVYQITWSLESGIAKSKQNKKKEKMEKMILKIKFTFSLSATAYCI